jgi:phosphatidylglycerol:prolipoprotein diacylglycerol transferase
VAAQVAAHTFERAGRSRDDGVRAVVWCMVAGLVGAKLWWVAEQAVRGAGGSLAGALFSPGGLTWYGGFLAGTAAALAFARWNGIPLLTVVDASAPAAAFGQALGRVGCFLVGDDYGRATDLPWGVAFPRGLPPTLERVHPTQLYEAAWLLGVGVWLLRRQGRSPFVLGEYLVLAGLGRLAIETLRTNPAFLGPLSNAQVVALACVAAGAAGWVVLSKRAGG